MDKIRFFDCNCVVGRRLEIIPGSYYETGELQRKMDVYGIDAALVYHSMAKEYNPSVGNEALAGEISGKPFFHGVWVVLPHHTGEFPEPSVLREEMKKNNIRAVRMFPAEHGYCFSELCCGDLFEMLETCRIPLMIGVRQASFNDLYDVMSVHPGLKLILTDLYYSVARNLYPLLKRFENVRVESMGYKIFGGIEEFCRLFGSERMIFGTGMPVYSAGSAASMINYADISPAEKRGIAGENLEKLLGGVLL